LAGLCGLSAQAAGAGNPPLQSVSNEDHHNGTLGGIALLMGLHYRDRTGQSVAFESSLVGSTLLVSSEVVMRADGTPIFRFELDGEQTGLGPLCRLYRASDGEWICLVVQSEREWRALCSVEGLGRLANAPGLGDPGRRAASAELAGQLGEWFAARRSAEALAPLKAAGVPAELARPSTRQSYFLDPENLAAGRVVELQHPVHGRMLDQGPTIRFSDMSGIVQRPAPTIGQHTAEILAELGLSRDETEALRQGKVIALAS
jgi:crotonobetainyl-CoA:carnitine CoA-transferase CaiB-like acyl-CoA transferase